MTLNKKYWYPWSPSRFMGATMHLTALQDGIYRRLIDHYMITKEPLPDNDTALARIAGVTVSEFGDNMGVIKEFFVSDKKGRLKNRLCDANLKKEKTLKKSYSERGQKGGKAKAEKANKRQELTSNSQTTAKQQPYLSVAHNTTGHNKTRLDHRDSSKNQQIKDSNSIDDNQNKSEFSKDSFKEKSFFSIETKLSDKYLESARGVAGRWDIYVLMREFDERVNNGQFNRPRAPGPAFVAWVKQHVKKNPV